MSLSQQESQETMFGMTTAELSEVVETSLSRLACNNNIYADAMTAMSFASDAQEEIDRGNLERSRQLINCVKWILNNYLMNER